MTSTNIFPSLVVAKIIYYHRTFLLLPTTRDSRCKSSAENNDDRRAVQQSCRWSSFRLSDRSSLSLAREGRQLASWGDWLLIRRERRPWRTTWELIDREVLPLPFEKVLVSINQTGAWRVAAIQVGMKVRVEPERRESQWEDIITRCCYAKKARRERYWSTVDICLPPRMNTNHLGGSFAFA